jgi:anti-sigma factor RsiW
MSVCDQIRLLLGPFNDGELEPHEMEDVALHVVSCSSCKAVLEDCRSLGVALRNSVRQPSLDGFTRAVMARIQRLPMRLRLRRYFDSVAERFGASLAIGAVGALAAALTVVVVTPYTHQMLNHRPSAQVASIEKTVKLANAPDEIAPAEAVPVSDPDIEADAQDVFGSEPSAPEPPTLAASSTYNPPMIAVSDDPKTATTVIWMPNR